MKKIIILAATVALGLIIAGLIASLGVPMGGVITDTITDIESYNP